jgi:hypothetical protein
MDIETQRVLRKIYLDGAARHRESAEHWRAVAAKAYADGDNVTSAFAHGLAVEREEWAREDAQRAGQFTEFDLNEAVGAVLETKSLAA